MRTGRNSVRAWQSCHASGFFLCFLLLAESRAADPLVPPEARPLGLLRQEPTEPGFRLGFFDVHLGIAGGGTYDDNISLSATNRQADYVGTITGNILAVADNRTDGIGTMLSLQYQPSGELFYRYTSNDAFNQYARLEALWAMPKWTLGVSQKFVDTVSGVVEVGRRIRQRSYNTDLGVQYRFSEKTSLDVGPRLAISESKDFSETKEYAVDSFLNWVYSPKLTAGVGGSFGYVDVEFAPTNSVGGPSVSGATVSYYYERALVRAIYTATAKLTLTATAGGEWRQYSGDSSQGVKPVFGIGGSYQPFERTTLTLEGHRREQPSLSAADQEYTTTGVTGEIRQRILKPFFISLSGGYDDRNYKTTRHDQYFHGRAGVGANFAHSLTFLVFAEHQQNDSNVDDQSFKNNRVGFETSWSY
jgi:hypothetical protein